MSVLLDKLISELQCMPGIGPKSAQRIALNFLERNRTNGLHLAETLATALKNIGHCTKCRNFTESNLCEICSDPKRDTQRICVVESPGDVASIEHTHAYNGLYFVLMGHLSPLDGIGPNELGLTLLENKIIENSLSEIILAISASIEGEATAHYIANIAKEHNLEITKLARGVPLGGELEYIDSGTLAHALSKRQKAD